MQRKLALKKLKESDLSFFNAYLTANPGIGKQKGITLDKRVMEADLYYPDLKAVIDGLPDQISPVALTFLGPGKAPPYLQMRKVIESAKNWRLNGEVVKAPLDDPTRFDNLAPGDIAIMEFSGVGAPTAMKAVLLSASHPDDAAVHAAFDTAFPGRMMSVISEDQIEEVIRAGAPSPDHPIRDWLDKDVLEEVGRGSGAAIELLARRRRGRGLSRSELQRAKVNAEAIGRLGEVLLDYHLGTASPSHDHAFHVWTADTNAISPYDFELTKPDGSVVHADAKSTAGTFNNPIHLSLAEIQHALTSDVPYRICRLYSVTEMQAKLRVANDVAARLAPLAATISTLPAGVKFDSLSFDPDFFGFEQTEYTISYEEDEDEA
jgi:hypothetical protein